MRILFGVLSLLVVLAIVGSIGKKQLQAIGSIGTSIGTHVTTAVTDPQTGARVHEPREGATVAVPGGVPGATPAGVQGTVPYQARQLEQNVLDRTNSAIQQSVDRYKRAEP
jgi:hypothetical protein